MNETLLLMPMLPLANFLVAFNESHISGKLIVLMLIGGSIYVWIIMLSKAAELKRADHATRRFLSAFRKDTNPVALFLRRQKFSDTPLYSVYEQGCSHLGGELEALGLNADNLFMSDMSADSRALTPRQFETMRNLTERNVADQSLELENQMGILATAVSISPFLGLLGTVWGVMEAFTAMAEVGTANLSAVAPGIAAALLTTVMGLLVALPSAVGYNILSAKIANVQVQMNNFSKEYMDKVATYFLQH